MSLEEKRVGEPAGEIGAPASDQLDYIRDVNSPLYKTAGVRKLEAAAKVWGPKTKWILFIGLALSTYVYSLDGMTTYTYNAMALSKLGNHSFLSTVGVANSVMVAVGKPFMAKLADVIGRGETVIVIALLYALGYAIVAASNSAEQLAAGQVIYSMGYTGLQFVQTVIVADVTNLRWRGFFTSLLSFWFLINAFIASEVSSAIQEAEQWRWGYGMFCIIMPVALMPVITALLWSQWKGKRNLRAAGDHLDDQPRSVTVKQGLRDMDFMGLILFAFALALILLPMTLAPKAKGQWGNASMIAMIVVGCVAFVIFLLYEWKIPARPVLPFRWMKRRPIYAACLIGFFDFVSFYLQFTYLYSYMLVTQPTWSFRIQNYFSYTQTLCLTLSAIMAGMIMAATRRFKWMLVCGLLVRLLGLGVMIFARSAKGNVAALVLCQVIQGMGGGIASLTMQVAAQAAVSHTDLATVVAVVLLLAEVGNSVGSAAAGGLWAQYMPGELAAHIPSANSTVLTTIFSDITEILVYPADDPVRVGAIAAYRVVMNKLIIGAIVVAIPPILFAIFLVKDIRLSDSQNAHDGKNNAGEQVEEPEEEYIKEVRAVVHRTTSVVA